MVIKLMQTVKYGIDVYAVFIMDGGFVTLRTSLSEAMARQIIVRLVGHGHALTQDVESVSIKKLTQIEQAVSALHAARKIDLVVEDELFNTRTLSLK